MTGIKHFEEKIMDPYLKIGFETNSGDHKTVKKFVEDSLEESKKKDLEKGINDQKDWELAQEYRHEIQELLKHFKVQEVVSIMESAGVKLNYLSVKQIAYEGEENSNLKMFFVRLGLALGLYFGLYILVGFLKSVQY